MTTARRICRTWFRGNFAFVADSDYLFGDLAFCSFRRLALGLDLLRGFAFCLCGSLHLRDPGSFSLCLLGRFALDLVAASRSAFSAASRCARSAASMFAFSAASRFACLAASRSAFRAASRSAFSAALRFARSMASCFAFSAASRFACCAASRRALSAAASLARSAAASRPVASRLAFLATVSSLAALLFASLTAAALLAVSSFAFFAASRASSPPALPHLRQNDVAPRRLFTPRRQLRAWRRSRLLSLQQPPAPRRQALLARLRLRDPWPLACLFSKRVELCDPVVCLIHAATLLAASSFAFFAAASSFATSCLAASASERRCSAAPFDSAAAASCLAAKSAAFVAAASGARMLTATFSRLGAAARLPFLGLLDVQFGFRFRSFWHGGVRSKWVEYICPKTCMARAEPRP